MKSRSRRAVSAARAPERADVVVAGVPLDSIDEVVHLVPVDGERRALAADVQAKNGVRRRSGDLVATARGVERILGGNRAEDDALVRTERHRGTQLQPDLPVPLEHPVGDVNGVLHVHEEEPLLEDEARAALVNLERPHRQTALETKFAQHAWARSTNARRSSGAP